jgi:hypothetical protein
MPHSIHFLSGLPRGSAAHVIRIQPAVARTSRSNGCDHSPTDHPNTLESSHGSI